ncbi:hypothetical protein E8F11_06450 [Pseudomonas sp. BN417]|uniref:hypothetical protein n=1 Tax=Pseudomonas sp. BN417 TaxID=2567890 RepID=UPI002455E6E2|nr:hypothetical protein [Pseudomonas sp. BN417]MDH4554820.1 hypothetical protein [Pseudomonas sp. BN417]
MCLPRLHPLFSVIFGRFGFSTARMAIATSGPSHGFARDITPESGERFQAFELKPAGDPDSR